jgi:hypothetical protein
MPERLLFRNKIERITQLHRNPDGTVKATTIHVGKKRSDPQRVYTPAEWTVRNLAESAASASSEYLRRHDRSNREVRGGWLFDLPANLWFAYRRGKRVFGWR